MLKVKEDSFTLGTRFLGYSSKEEYLHSPLYRTIQREILNRDSLLCRTKSCNNPAKIAAFIGYSKPVLLGIAPGCIVSVCKDCIRRATEGGLESEFIANRILLYVSGFRKTSRFSNRNIGIWFKNQFADNQSLARRLYKILSEQHPGYSKLVKRVIEAPNPFTGETSLYYGEYLGITKETPNGNHNNGYYMSLSGRRGCTRFPPGKCEVG